MVNPADYLGPKEDIPAGMLPPWNELGDGDMWAFTTDFWKSKHGRAADNLNLHEWLLEIETSSMGCPDVTIYPGFTPDEAAKRLAAHDTRAYIAAEAERAGKSVEHLTEVYKKSVPWFDAILLATYGYRGLLAAMLAEA
jgi:hypothetical protein